MAPEDLDVLAASIAVTTAPALVTAVHADDARMVEHLLAGLDRQRLYALAVVLADRAREVPLRPRRQSKAAARLEDYAWCRWQGASVAEAAVRVGISVGAANKNYEPMLRECAS
jgi:hypothetical protein